VTHPVRLKHWPFPRHRDIGRLAITAGAGESDSTAVATGDGADSRIAGWAGDSVSANGTCGCRSTAVVTNGNGVKVGSGAFFSRKARAR
jgi:hypothetical protein